MATVRVFRVGDLVRWTSASHGVWRHHVGIVVAEVPAGDPPYEHRPPGAHWSWLCRDNTPRPQVSYLVALKDARGRTGKLYRPRVRYLRHYTEGEPVVVEVRRSRKASAAPGLPVPIAPRQPPDPRARRLANGATFRPDQECRDLVVWRPRFTRRDLRIAAAFAPVFAVLFYLLVTGMQQVVP